MTFVHRSTFAAILLAGLLNVACEQMTPTTDQKQAAAQEAITQNLSDMVGMPNIKNGRERRMMKEILEARDNASFATYTYVYSENTGKFTFICHSVGFPIPYATQFTSPSKEVWHSNNTYTVVPQSDPNGMFMPAGADATFVMCQHPKTGKLVPVYSEPKFFTPPFELDDSIVINKPKDVPPMPDTGK